jgi:hypothetical protein
LRNDCAYSQNGLQEEAAMARRKSKNKVGAEVEKNGDSAERREFDVIMKALIDNSSVLPLHLGGSPVSTRLNIEFSEIEKRLADYLARLEDGSLLHVEFQSTVDPDMVWRMLNYRRLIRIKVDKESRVHQVVLYVGDEADVNLKISDDDLYYSCHAIDIRTMDAGVFLGANCFDDNLLALLCRNGGSPYVVRRVAEKYDMLDAASREDAYVKLAYVAGLRGLTDLVAREIKTMPSVALRDNPLFKIAVDEVYHEGEVGGMARAILTSLEAKGFEVADQIRDAVLAADEETLLQMIRLAATAGTIEQFAEEASIELSRGFGR